MIMQIARFAGDIYDPSSSLSVPLIDGESGFHVPAPAPEVADRREDLQLYNDLIRGVIGPVTDPGIQKAIKDLHHILYGAPYIPRA